MIMTINSENSNILLELMNSQGKYDGSFRKLWNSLPKSQYETAYHVCRKTSPHFSPELIGKKVVIKSAFYAGSCGLNPGWSSEREENSGVISEIQLSEIVWTDGSHKAWEVNTKITCPDGHVECLVESTRQPSIGRHEYIVVQ